MSKVDDVFKEATKTLNFGNWGDRLVGTYVRRRAEQVVAQSPATAASALAAGLVDEWGVIATYVHGLIVKLVQGPDPTVPAHFKLDDVADIYSYANQYTAGIEAVAKTRYRILRQTWIVQIVWGAMTVQGDQLWKTHSPAHVLEVVALTTLVDHRLRAVEIMHYLVNTGGGAATLGNRPWNVAGAAGPWTDGYRVRVVEYPGLPKEPFEDIASQLGAAGWSIEDTRITYQDPHSNPKNLPMRVPPSIASAWKPWANKGGTPWVLYQKASTGDPIATLEKMFEIPRENYLDRSILFCDMVGSATQLAALAHSRKRRGLGVDTILKDKMNSVKDYAAFGPVLQTPRFNTQTNAYDLVVNLGCFMADPPNDLFFENILITVDDLQVGDFVLFWNSRIYLQIESGAWGNEFSFVMGIDPDPLTGRIPIGADGPRIEVSGHGLAMMSYGAMAADLVSTFEGPFGSLTRQRGRVFSAGSATTILAASGNPKLVKWEPYQAFDSPGAWWIELGRDVWETEWGFNTLADAMAAVPRTVAHDPSGGTDYRSPPQIDALYFPLYEPRVAQSGSDRDSWSAYLRKRRSEPGFRAPGALAPLAVDKNLALGLFYRGSKNKFPVVRPRVIK